MRPARVLLTRARAVMGLHQVLDLERRVDELATAAAENAYLDSLLEPTVAELEQTVAEVARRRLPPAGPGADERP